MVNWPADNSARWPLEKLIPYANEGDGRTFEAISQARYDDKVRAADYEESCTVATTEMRESLLNERHGEVSG